jgi:hypothetical protein
MVVAVVLVVVAIAGGELGGADDVGDFDEFVGVGAIVSVQAAPLGALTGVGKVPEAPARRV